MILRRPGAFFGSWISTTRRDAMSTRSSTNGSGKLQTDHNSALSSRADVIRRAFIAAFAVAALLVGGAAAKPANPLERAALQALATTRVDASTAARGRAEIRRAAQLARALPSGRGEHVAVALREIASYAGLMTDPRAISLIGELAANDDYFAQHYAPPPKTDITDEDGIVYRYFPGRCFEFHPLANFGALNARVARRDAEGAHRLADALVARGVYQHSGGIGWEYTFPFAGGRAPWLSGMAQAVAAQALARTAALVPEETTALMSKARAAYQAIPGRLLTSVAAGPWIRLYSFTSLPVLNAQLQAVISLESYAGAAEDDDAAALASRMQRSAAAALPQFDTGYWSYYSLPHEPSPLDYHEYVVQLLKQLAPADPRFAAAATRFAAYETQPPAFQLAPGGLGTLTFWLSKPSTVSVVTGAGPARRVSLDGGWHTLSWPTPRRAGAYGVHVSATDAGGHTAAFDALPFVRASSTLAAPARSTAASPPTPAAAAPGLLAGAGLTDPAQAASAAKAGLRLVRLQVTWPTGATAVDPTTAAALQRLAPGIAAVIDLAANPLPADDAGRAALAQFAASLVAQVRSLHSLVLTPGPTTATGAAYVSALAVIDSALPATPLGLPIDGSTDPAAAVAASAGAPVEFVDFRPASTPGPRLWTYAALPQLADAFPDAQFVLDGVPAPFTDLIKASSCTTTVTGVLLDRLTDATRPSVLSTIQTAQRGGFVCPGFTAEAAPFDVQFPAALAPQPITVGLNCNRDCVYLVTLDRADGRPVVAKRGSLDAGLAGRVTRITLPKAKLPPGTYKVDVRLVSRVNPGAVTRYLGPPMSVG
jgi:D-glucuronyl C5-epimerase C-terminus